MPAAARAAFAPRSRENRDSTRAFVRIRVSVEIPTGVFSRILARRPPRHSHTWRFNYLSWIPLRRARFESRFTVSSLQRRAL
jgi:hypothetical protein